MKYVRNMKDVQEGSANTIVSVGTHEFIITLVKNKVTKNGDPMASIKLECNFGDTDQGNSCWDNIVIPKEDSPAIKIMGRTKHFLHCIGEPYDTDNLDIDDARWINKIVTAEVIHEGPNEHHKGTVAVISKYILVEGLGGNF